MAITKLKVIAIPKNDRAKVETGPNPIPAVVHSVICPRCMSGTSILQIKFGSDVLDADAIPRNLEEFLKLHKCYHDLAEKRRRATAEDELEMVRILDRLKEIKRKLAVITEYYEIRGNPPAAAMRA